MTLAIQFLTIPFRILRWIFKHPRVLILLVAIGMAIFAFRACSSVTQGTVTENGNTVSYTIPQAQSYQTIAPTIKQAPTVIATGTRIYYVSQFEDDGKVVMLLKYYTFDKDTWQFSNKPLPLDRNSYGLITIYKR